MKYLSGASGVVLIIPAFLRSGFFQTTSTSPKYSLVEATSLPSE
ncbi:hypothetical protein ABIE26_002667 [Pedobacter africanus]|uniref:Uncharacterized protein n=1 Tax=Pedobacter africanus TaxID=151894 RepID=A0ACC6KXU7_9SPHI|nr:hypothetical protein [Pedobacter africanus]